MISHEHSPLPSSNDFVYHSLKAGEIRDVGFDMFYEWLLTFSQEDSERLTALWEDVDPGLVERYTTELSHLPLTPAELTFIAKAASVIVTFNGKQLGEGMRSQEDITQLTERRIEKYKDTDGPLIYRKKVTLLDFEGTGLMMCAEAAVTGQALSARFPEGRVITGIVVSNSDTPHAGGHQLNFLISEQDRRVVLADLAYSVPVTQSDGKKLGVPFVEVLTPEQIASLENGKDTTCSSFDVSRSYRIGTPHTRSGTFKSQLVNK